MSERDRLRELVETLPPQQVHALLTLLDSAPMCDEDFARLLAEAPEEHVDEETVDRVLASGAEAGETISHEELKRRLGLATKPGL